MLFFSHAARLETLSKSCSDSTPKSEQRKESMWNTAAKIRKLRSGIPSAERKRAESIPSSRGDIKTLGTTPSPPGKSRQRKVSRN